MAYRFYSFVAHHYLSPLQCGLQTAHAVSEMSLLGSYAFDEWAENNKTIIICGAGNHAGVKEAFTTFKELNNKRLSQKNNSIAWQVKIVMFNEDITSMNGMSTAVGVLVPDYFYDAQYEKIESEQYPGGVYTWVPNDPSSKFSQEELEFVTYLKSFRLV